MLENDIYILEKLLGSILILSKNAGKTFTESCNNPDVKAFLNGICTLPFECKGSPFEGKDHYHIITDDLKIITTNKLRTKEPRK